MKRIGILGGMGPEATILYYSYITGEYNKRFGDYAFPEIIIYSVKFQQFLDLFYEGKWETVSDEVLRGLDRLHRAGADFGIMATNTLHRVFEMIQKRSPLPLISIIDSVIEAIKSEKMQTVGLLATMFTMKEGFYVNRLRKEGIQTILPERKDQQRIQEIIVSELTIGRVERRSKETFLRIIDKFENRGAKGIILGCTEIPLLLHPEECNLRLFNSTLLHAESALRYALAS